MSAETDNRQLPERVAVGRIRKPHGVRGEVSVETMSDVEDRFAPGSALTARLSDGRLRHLVVASSRSHRDVVLVRFESFTDRATANELRSAVLEIEQAEVPPSPEGSYYYYELIGCRCVDRSAGELGRVSRLIEDGGGLLLELESSAGTALIPFVEAYLSTVDVERGLIELDLPVDLVETCTSTS